MYYPMYYSMYYSMYYTLPPYLLSQPPECTLV
jgi:hypothetical protein